MSSRVLPVVAAAAAQAMSWRSADGHAPAQVLRLRSPETRSEEPDQAAQIHLEAVRAQARSAGEAAGMERAAKRLDPVMANLNEMIGELARLRQRLRAEAEEDTVKLAIAIARRVLHRELATDPEAILGLVKAAFGKLNARETHRLRISPEDASAIDENLARLELPPRVEIVRDPSLRRGSVVFETSRGELDASVDTQIAEIERGLADVMKRRSK